ncbi:SPOR domain-containing protein [Marinobacterium rhizophilum]|uniref:SPOR domain-containing protein n=1 Tax=Marinobacterium rhizophilum TaxID=420402 RepID=A0ABY5HDR9_9GAMM|nr:SPOR domain-containing protein [Marinobacterium rhizophilum]UTW10486.1 SPOR domain-containing protein [Marinobacterium rhizophilum]
MVSRKDFAQKNSRSGGASRSRASAPKPAPGRQKSAWPLALVSLAAIAGLAYGLMRLTDFQSAPVQQQTAPPAKAPVAARPAPTPVEPDSAPVPKAAVKDITVNSSTPEAEPQPRFDFYEMLPKSEVEAPTVEAYKSTPRNAKLEQSYLLQAGSFRDPADAERMRAQLLLAGLPNVRTSKTEGSNGIWYRVRTGPFDNRAAINKAQNKMAKMNIQSMQIQQ